jgi:hypothetical protein
MSKNMARIRLVNVVAANAPNRRREHRKPFGGALAPRRAARVRT